ncbi:MAG: TlpA family protein disulfide reductase [Polyangiales bacterium]
MIPTSHRREWLAALITTALALPLCVALVHALLDARQRAEEAPLRLLLGDDSFTRLRRGEKTGMHYLGDDRIVPNFTLPDHLGRPWNMQKQRGKVVVLNFWSVTCKPCLEEMPSLIELARIVADDKDIEVVAVSVDKDWPQVATLFPPKMQLRVLFDPDKKVVQGRFGTRMYPETWIIDREGTIRLRLDAPRDWSAAVVIDWLRSL